MVEFIGAFLGALCGAFIPVGIVMYRTYIDIKKQFKEFTDIAMFTSTGRLDVKHEL